MLSQFDFTPTVDSALQYEITYPWFQFIKSTLHFGIDGLSMLLVILTNILVPLIILSSYNENKSYSNNFYALILLMQFARKMRNMQQARSAKIHLHLISS